MLAAPVSKKSPCRGNVWRPLRQDTLYKINNHAFKWAPGGGVTIRSTCKGTSLRQVVLTSSLPLLLYQII